MPANRLPVVISEYRGGDAGSSVTLVAAAADRADPPPDLAMLLGGITRELCRAAASMAHDRKDVAAVIEVVVPDDCAVDREAAGCCTGTATAG